MYTVPLSGVVTTGIRLADGARVEASLPLHERGAKARAAGQRVACHVHREVILGQAFTGGGACDHHVGRHPDA
jgi:hypothetical protein